MTALKLLENCKSHIRGNRPLFIQGVWLTIAFLLMIVITQLEEGRPYLVGLAALLAATLPWIKRRFTPLHTAILGYMAGFLLYRAFNDWIGSMMIGHERIILLNRLSLILIIAPIALLSFMYREKPIPYLGRPDLRAKLFFPFIESGFHQVTVRTFLIIAFLINAAVFAPFIFMRKESLDPSFFVIAISFAVINSILEEVLWRGVLLRRFGEAIGVYPGLMVTSLGFGLQHHSLGFDWWICLLFAGGGIFYGAVVLRSGSLYPAIVWHGVLNLLMAYSGLILLQTS
ncbi:CPBP family intramembrane glutamic endopeptidase [Paenibacillus sp. J2TS4]|uniref:CPBP family intramembrane glutamic endopeptidase n=1 Tax=Paenibacillus sp. J2TS4 TaxID=2807194 RepID=UPI001B1DA3D6|nr:type II CAAX endopeptidase family protein [Paenibacillus sp. J2TS4]GIP33176.1 hypothetical protein J2TS4_23860 [Paenibacillus sp. J2TS4]